ncbi:MAG TPA: adenosylmethionine decarboxylase [Polyangiales bacterium]|nr:adenosylmethionine decarboxylase [Polyangiales bacterium]
MSELNTRGRHLLVEYTGCDASVLDDLKRIEALMNQAAKAARTNIVASVFQPFEPQGVTGVVVVEESHLSIHTWPEHGYAAVDFFTCGEAIPEMAHRVLSEGLRAERAEVIFVDRGISHTGPSMRMRSHSTEHYGERAYERASEHADIRVSETLMAAHRS